MRIGTYFGFVTGALVGACLVSMNPKVKDTICEVKQKAMEKMEEGFCQPNNTTDSAAQI